MHRSRPLRPAPARWALAVIAAVVVGRPAAAQPAHPAPAAPGVIDRANFDSTCAACTDFFRFANGGWLARTRIPAARTRWGSASELAERNRLVLRGLILEAAADTAAAAGSAGGRIGAFYRSCMDSAAAARAGAGPIRPLLAAIDAIAARRALPRGLGALERRAAVAPLAPFSVEVAADPADSRRTIITVDQGGTTLTDRDFSLSPSPRAADLRGLYAGHVARMLALAGASPAGAREDAARVLALETRLAAAQAPREALRDPRARYNRRTVAELERLTPGFDWVDYLGAVGARGVTRATAVNVAQPAFFAALDSLYAAEPLAAWKVYLRWRALSTAAGALSGAFADEQLAFARTLTGATAPPPRWERCVGATNAALGGLVGREYVRRTFTPEDKARARRIVADVRAALRERIGALAWMSAGTKARALAKLDALAENVGYPDVWRDDAGLEIADAGPGAFYANVRVAARSEAERAWGKLGRPADRAEWTMSPAAVDAYYTTATNRLVLPAGILQPPFYTPGADDAVNYGAVGAVIGHEMTHAFDDRGRRFDARGELRDWWTPADAARFTSEARRVVAQFDAYTVVDSATRVNGRLTLGENIADLGGLTVAYAAMQRAYAGRPRPAVDGFTPEQRFFLGWAQVWREQTRAEQARVLAATDVHAPAVWRVNGPLSNMPEFRAACGCRDADAMVRPAGLRASVW